jgi:hypothetical protein
MQQQKAQNDNEKLKLFKRHKRQVNEWVNKRDSSVV